MNGISRGVRNAFRNAVRTLSIVIILGLSIGLSLTMLVAHRAVGQKIDSVKSSIGNTVTIAPAGVQGFEGGGNPLTSSQLDGVKSLAHVTKLDESVNDRLTSSNTSLTSAVDAGSLGKRFFMSQNGDSGGSAMFGGGGQAFANFTPPVIVLGTTDPASLNGTALKLTSGSQIDGSKDNNVALVGKNLASKNNLSAGSTFTAYGTTVTVAGVFDTGTQFANNQVVFSLPTLQRLSGQSGDVTSATATVDSISNMDSVTSAIKSKLGSSADVTNSKDAASTAIAPLQSIQNVSLYSLVGAVIAGAVIILLTMIMIVRERKREIGVMKAIGAGNVRIVLQFMAEALTLTVLGAMIGLIIGVVGGNPVTKTLVRNSTTSSATTAGQPPGGGSGGAMVTRRGGFGGFTRSLRQNSTVRGLDNIQAEIGWGILLDGFGAAVFIAVVGSAIAAGMIAEVRPAQVMRAD